MGGASELAREKGNAAYRREQWHEAIQWYTEAIHETNDDVRPLGNRSACYAMVGKYAEALRDEHAASEAAEAAAAPTALLAPSPPSLEEADGGAPGELTSSVLPQSIDEVIRYMDERAPLARYYERQADSAGGCSRTRSKLRAHAKLHPNDPAVAFWVAAGGGGGRVVPWMPPDAHSLEALVNLLKQIIGPP